MSAGNSPKRRKQPRTQRHYDRIDARNRQEVRACCPTSVRERHLPDCIRTSKCRDKVPHMTREIARAAAASLSKWQGEQVTAYRCFACDLWHIGHPQSAAEGLEA